MIRLNIKKALPDIIALIVLVLLAVGYFITPISDGMVLNQHDTLAGAGAVQEAKAFREATGNVTRWTNSSFGGMPTYQISPSYGSTNIVKQMQHLFDWYLPNPANLVLMMLIGFYILLRALSVRPLGAVLGAVMYAFSSYFFIIIQAGHIWKFVTLAYIPPTLAGVILAFNRKYVQGGLITAFFLTMQILSNHIQMSYYFGFVILFIALAYLVDAVRKGQLKSYLVACVTLLIAVLVAVSVNCSTLYHTYEYSKHTMRGKSELQQNVENHTDNGLERDYIVQWSYGIGETFSLLIPNVRGGKSEPLGADADAMKHASPQYRTLYGYFTQYFGEQPMTSGPVYVGAFVLTLFLLGVFLVKGPLKWALLGATALSVLLSWGQNFMAFTDFFLDYVPMYNKFRTVSSILVVAEFTIPLLAILCLKEIWERPSLLKEKQKWVYVSVGVTGGLCLLCALFPTLFAPSMISTTDQSIINAIGAQAGGANAAQVMNAIIGDLTNMRVAYVTGDAWRSLWVILVGTLLLLSIRFMKIKPEWSVAAMILLCVVDMGNVNKRYLNDTHFVSKQNVKKTFTPTNADKIILQDKDPNFRVLNFTTSTFNDAMTSYFHKSVGGYHAAKLRRYQDIINNYLTDEMSDFMQTMARKQGTIDSIDADQLKVINMLNTKYFIVGSKDQKTLPIRNPYAYGNAWFVRAISYVDTPDEEIASIGSTDLKQIAIVDRSFADKIGYTEAVADSSDYIVLKTYEPNRLVYETQSVHDNIAVFSEIYYPDGWHIYIDGKEASLFRADYILRGMNVPAGKHCIEAVFAPQSIRMTESVAYAAMVFLVVAFIAFLAYSNRKRIS